MKKLTVKISDHSYGELIKIARRCGFEIKQGKKHCKIVTKDDIFVTMVPRHNTIKRETAKGIAKRFKEFYGEIEII